MRPIIITKQLAASSTTAVCASQTPGAAGNLTINGGLATAGVATLDTQRIVGIISTGDISNRTFTVYGTDDQGNVISEALTGPNNATVSTILNYKTVTQIAISGAAAAAITVGTTGVGATKPIPLEQHVSPFATAVFVEIGTGKTVNVSVQYTPDDVFSQANIVSATGLNWTTMGTLSSKTASADSNLAFPPAAVRLLINSGTDAAKMIIRQAGLWG